MLDSLTQILNGSKKDINEAELLNTALAEVKKVNGILDKI
jgi:hypothetical protein